MGSGKIVALVAAIIGILSVTLGFVLPEWMGWYRVIATTGGLSAGYAINGFGMLVAVGPVPPPPPEYALFFMPLIGGIMVAAGSVLLIIGALKESRAAGIIGGVVVLLGPMLLVLDLLIGIGDYSMLVPPGQSLFFGSIEIMPGVFYNWGLWIGSFLALGGGVLGLIGGATV